MLKAEIVVTLLLCFLFVNSYGFVMFGLTILGLMIKAVSKISKLLRRIEISNSKISVLILDGISSIYCISCSTL